jgi:ATP-dependent Clp protease, protease subunit
MDKWIRFSGAINDKTCHALMQVTDECFGMGVDHIHLMISSLGGNVYHGSVLFSHLERLPVKISTYNTAFVHSIGVTLFCAGDERYCVPEATFMIHPIQMSVAQNQMLNAQQFLDLADSCTAQTRSIASIIANATGQSVDQVYEDMNRTTWFNAQQSQSYGLVKTVTTDLLPAGIGYTAIYEDGTIRICPTQSPNLADMFGMKFPTVAPNPN